MGIDTEQFSNSHFELLPKLGKEAEIASGSNPRIKECLTEDLLQELVKGLADQRLKAYPDKPLEQHTEECRRDIIKAHDEGTLGAAIVDEKVVSILSIHPIAKTIDGKPIFAIGRASTIPSMRRKGLYSVVQKQLVNSFRESHDPYETPLLAATKNPHVIEYRRNSKEWKEANFINPPSKFPKDLSDALRRDVEEDGETFFLYDPEDKYDFKEIRVSTLQRIRNLFRRK